MEPAMTFNELQHSLPGAAAVALLLLASPSGAQSVASTKESTMSSLAQHAASTPNKAAESDTSIRPFQVHFSDTALADLRRRIDATQWPEKETVADESQGVPLATMKEL